MKPFYINRRQAAKYVRETYGTNCSEKWLAKLVVTGGGPWFWKNGRAVLYTVNSLDAWHASRTKGPWASSSCLKSIDAYYRSIHGLPLIDIDDIDEIEIDDAGCNAAVSIN
jgi:hypothetical protein